MFWITVHTTIQLTLDVFWIITSVHICTVFWITIIVHLLHSGSLCNLYYDGPPTFVLDVDPQHQFFLNGKEVPIRIESSDRTSHRLVSEILRILLQDVLGYPMVDIVYEDSYNAINITQILNRLAGCQLNR